MNQTSYRSRAHGKGKGKAEVLGRSAVTGKLVLKPASKPGSISIRDAMTAVRTVNGTKKK